MKLTEGLFLKRYKRFFADIQVGDEVVTAHVPNTGSLLGCLKENSPCLFSTSDDPKRKLKYTLQMIKTPDSWVGVNTGISNRLVWEAWEEGRIPSWQEYDSAQREVKLHDKTRIDMVLWKSLDGTAKDKKISSKNFTDHSFHFVEIKNVTLGRNGVAQFPDAVTTRGQKHLQELMDLIDQGHTSELVFTIQREDCHSFSPADSIDPEYGRLLREAIKKGVKVSAYTCLLAPEKIELQGQTSLAINCD